MFAELYLVSKFSAIVSAGLEAIIWKLFGGHDEEVDVNK